jgi:hypothetical protein
VELLFPICETFDVSRASTKQTGQSRPWPGQSRLYEGGFFDVVVLLDTTDEYNFLGLEREGQQ